MTRRLAWMSGFALGLVMLCRTSQAEPNTDNAAREHFMRGQKLSEVKRYVEAAAEFEAGYSLSHRPVFLFNIAECARLSGNTVRARESYERYLREDPQGKLASQAKERLAALGPRPAGSPLVTPLASPTSPSRPAQAQSNPSPERSLTMTKLTPPVAPVSASALALTTPAPAPREVDRPFYKGWPFWVGVGAVVVAGTVTAVVLSSSGGVDCGAHCLDFRR